jgi:hypothetical protein
MKMACSNAKVNKALQQTASAVSLSGTSGSTVQWPLLSFVIRYQMNEVTVEPMSHYCSSDIASATGFQQQIPSPAA